MDSHDTNIETIRAARMVCFFAHYHPQDLLADHVFFYLQAIRSYGFTIVVLSTSSLSQADEDRLATIDAILIRRPNEGLDFGGWIEACQRFFPLRAELLMLANDSVYAPVGDLSQFLDTLLAIPADVYGAVESLEVAPHLQSWLMLFRPTAYRSSAFVDLMTAPMPALEHKWALIERYEVGLTRRLRASGLKVLAAISMKDRPGLAGRRPYNPTHLAWRELIEDGLPFLKIDLLRTNPMRVADIGDWRTVVGHRRPELVAMIDDDLGRRPGAAPPSLAALSRWDPIYWPEVRSLVRADYRQARGRRRGFSPIIVATFHAVVAITTLPRLAWRAWQR